MSRAERGVAVPIMDERSGRRRAKAWRAVLALAVLALWAGLFKLVDITFFDTLFFSSSACAWIATCTAAALAVTKRRRAPRSGS